MVNRVIKHQAISKSAPFQAFFSAWLAMEKNNLFATKTVIRFTFFLFVIAFITAFWMEASFIGFLKLETIHKYSRDYKIPAASGSSNTETLKNTLDCSIANLTQTCSANSPLMTGGNVDSESPLCPEYFRWIHENLKPWKDVGISRETVESGRSQAFFRLVVINGRVYLKKYKNVARSQSRDLYTIWGILQLLRKYPGKLPDLDIMFNCADKPVITSEIYHGPKARTPPPIFHYCGDDKSFDIVFPDWSFWGWPEIHIKPWDSLLEELKQGNERVNWDQREPYAYWKGNPSKDKSSRLALMKCNVTDKQEWNARLYLQNWAREEKEGFKQSKLANQCNHRYKIYIEGVAWSVSMKYILACDSVTLIVDPKYYDFITRALKPMHHYWPIRDDDDKCRSIKFAVDWGNNHTQEAKAIGKAASKFILEDMKMDYVYDYMFHLLNEYGNLLRYKPTVPDRATEICLEALACPVDGLKKEFLLESMVKEPSIKKPCTLPPPFDPSAFEAILKEKEDSMNEVDAWKRKYLQNQSQ